jgi:hypothetical protein
MMLMIMMVMMMVPVLRLVVKRVLIPMRTKFLYVMFYFLVFSDIWYFGYVLFGVFCPPRTF